MLEVAEKELALKDRKIQTLEAYIAELRRTGKASDQDIARMEELVNADQAMLARELTNPNEESKMDDTVIES